ncbi:MAG: ethanolamine utilization protein EutA [Alphaproteobacteria bacterium]|nr:ethanolamine utilization protein EutA [Alphaproteobacteria bacterium]
MYDEEEEGGRVVFAEQRNLAGAEKTSLVSVGVDIGSSTSHLVFSRLRMEQRDGRYVAAERQVIYDSDIFLTPYTDQQTIDSDKLADYIAGQYRSAQLRPDEVDTGALILTGLAVRRQNARAIGELFAVETGKFVSVSAGDQMEAAMAAYGSGAVINSKDVGVVVMNIDIGGGTTKVAICDKGEIVGLTAVDIGARLIAFDDAGTITRIEEAGRIFIHEAGLELSPGDHITAADCENIAEKMADRLEEIITLRVPSTETEALHRLAPISWRGEIDALTFSGGVSEFIYGYEESTFGDLGNYLGRAIHRRIESAGYRVMPPVENIRATVVGASQYTIQLSGTTIMVSDETLLPLRNIPVIKPAFALELDEIDQTNVTDAVTNALLRLDQAGAEQPIALCFDWLGSASYQRIHDFLSGVSEGLSRHLKNRHPLVMVCEGDIGKVFGIHAAEELKLEVPIISIDSIALEEFDYIDIGDMMAASGAVPVVIKSLLFPDSAALGRDGVDG